MKFFDKFKRKTKPNTVENGDFTKPEALQQESHISKQTGIEQDNEPTR